MSDLIDRQALIDAFEKELSAKYNRLELAIGFVGVKSILEKMPSAEPERKKGRWINAECKDGTIAHKCSECKCFVGYSVSSLTWFNFCPWCGADMRGGEDDNIVQ